MHARDVYAYLTLAATVSHRITLGTSVTNPLSRHPALSVAAIASVDEISGGRAIFGVGAGALVRRPASLRTVREMVEVSRRLLRGEQVTIEADTFGLDNAQIRTSVRADLPIYISASGPKTRARG